MIEAIKAVINSIATTMISVSRVTEKSVGLVEKEVDNLEAYQDLRMQKHSQELETRRRDFQKQLEAM